MKYKQNTFFTVFLRPFHRGTVLPNLLALLARDNFNYGGNRAGKITSKESGEEFKIQYVFSHSLNAGIFAQLEIVHILHQKASHDFQKQILKYFSFKILSRKPSARVAKWSHHDRECTRTWLVQAFFSATFCHENLCLGQLNGQCDVGDSLQ